ncbi:leukotriene B4 receptor 1-like [Polymixia lowei]
MNDYSTSENVTVDLSELSSLGQSVSCVVLGLSFLVGTPGNLLVIWTILKHVKHRSHTVVLILHLAAADLLVLITLPLWIYSLARSWVFGEAACKAMVYIINACMYSSVFLITLMSVERFVAIRYPFVMLQWKTKTVMNKFLVVVWFLAFVFGTPAIVTQSLDKVNGTEHCLFRNYSSVAQEAVCLSLEILVGFAVPFTVLTICYYLVAAQLRGMHFNTKQKSMVLISSVIVAFILCWLPHHIINIIELILILTTDAEVEYVELQPATFIAGALVFISNSVNPVLYAFAARSFQGSLQESRLVKMFQEVAAASGKLKVAGNTTSDGSEGNKTTGATDV